MNKSQFIVLETKIMNGSIFVYGGLVPPPNDNAVASLVDFQWFKLSEIKRG